MLAMRVWDSGWRYRNLPAPLHQGSCRVDVVAAEVVQARLRSHTRPDLLAWN